MSKHKRELKRRERQRMLTNREAMSAPRRAEIERMAELENDSAPPADIPTAEVAAGFRDMMARTMAINNAAIHLAQAKRTRRMARNLVQSKHVMGERVL